MLVKSSFASGESKTTHIIPLVDDCNEPVTLLERYHEVDRRGEK